MRYGLRNIRDSFKTVSGIIIILWMIYVLGLFFPIENFGIRPRSISGLYGIPLAPFIHIGFTHLVANSISLLILGSIFLTMERKLSLPIVIYIILIGGLGTWFIGRSEFTHVGASGVIYGILGYLIAMGVFNRNIKTILVSLAIFVAYFLYGGAMWGIFPTGGFVSWESHLCGFVAGIGIAKMYARSRR